MSRLWRAAAVLACVAALAACDPAPRLTPSGAAPTVTASTSEPRATPSSDATDGAACTAVEHPEEQSGGHLVGDSTPPVDYSSTPGTSGWHAGEAPRTGVFDTEDPLSEPELVLALEVGQVVAAYDPTTFDPPSIAQFERLAKGRFADELTVTPFEGDMGSALTLNAWATRQACDSLDSQALTAFVREFRGRGPGSD